MSGQDTKVKDLSEMERLILGSSVNFVFNVFNNQIEHILHHDEELAEMLKTDLAAQEDLILLQNFRKISSDLTDMIGGTFSDISDAEKAYLTPPAAKLEMFFKSLFDSFACGSGE